MTQCWKLQQQNRFGKFGVCSDRHSRRSAAVQLDFDLDFGWILVGCWLDLDLDALDFQGRCLSSNTTIQYISN